MDPGKIFQIITNSTLLATRLLSESGRSVIEFSQNRYCAAVREDFPTSSTIITVTAGNRQGGNVKYSISGGNTDGLFSIDEDTGAISLAASLDYEVSDTHEILVSGEGGGQVVHAVVQVSVTDVNDNAPVFLNRNPHVTVIEEDDRHLPASLIKVKADDLDQSDFSNLRYSLRGDGVDGYGNGEAYFSINRQTGDITQLRALDRDPPNGKRIWQLKVKVEDGQEPLSLKLKSTHMESNIKPKNGKEPPWTYGNGYQNNWEFQSRSLEDKKENAAVEAVKYDTSSKYISDDSKHPVLYKRKTSSEEQAFGNVRTNYKNKEENVNEQKERQISPGKMIFENRSLGILGMKGETTSSNQRTSTYRYEKNTEKDRNLQLPSHTEPSRMHRRSRRQRRHQKSKLNMLDDICESISHKDHVKILDLGHVASRISTNDAYSKENLEETNNNSDSLKHHAVDGETVQPTDVDSIPKYKYQMCRHHPYCNCKGKRKASSWKRKLKDEDRYEEHQNHTSKVKELQNQTYSGENSRKPPEGTKYYQGVSKSIGSKVFPINDTAAGNIKGKTTINPYKAEKKEEFQKSFPKFNIPEGQMLNELPVAVTETNKNANNPQYNRAATISDESKFFESFSVGSFQTLKSNLKTWNTEGSLGLESGSSNIRTNSTLDANIWEISSQKRKREFEISLLTVVNKLRSKKSSKEIPGGGENPASSKSTDKCTREKSLVRKGEEENNFGGNSPLTSNKEDSGGNSPSSSVKGIGSSALVARWMSKHTLDPRQSPRRAQTFQKKLEFSKSLKSSDFLVSYTTRHISSSTSLRPSPAFLPSYSLFKKKKYTSGLREEKSFALENNKKNHIRKTSTTGYPELTSGDISSADSRYTLENSSEKQTDDDQSSYTNDQIHFETFGRYSDEGTRDINRPRSTKKMRNIRNVEEDIGEIKNFLREDDCHEPTTSSHVLVSEVVHSAEATVTIVVKDINDNPPVFPNVTMFGEVQENGEAGLSVAQVSAWDTDDATEGTNARIAYSIEKNVIHERSGEAIFSIHPQSGLITTSLCCLDREATPEYYIQVVAADGGGLKGTGTVIVQLSDENDNSPHLARKSWQLEVNETYGEGPPDESTLLEMTAADPDSENEFLFRIVQDSGFGWDHFGIRSSGSAGQLHARKKLDYEDPEHLQGFRFMVQLSDRGESGWNDPHHQDTAWVGVKLRDLNDNPPHFQSPFTHITVTEDTPVGTLLFNMAAYDPDTEGGGRVTYEIIDGWDTLRVNESGGLTLSRPLDRESRDRDDSVFRIVARDQGNPPLTSTGTLSVSVSDVNDCPPRLQPPRVLHVLEGEPPVLLGVLTATDDDMWALGHGPPFSLSLAPSNPPEIQELIELKFDQRVDSGRGGAELWTRKSLDRELHRQLQVQVLAVDAGGLNSTNTVTIVVGDLNDNPMNPASKTVYLWKTQNTGSDAPLGRIYVDDPDDWDVADKSFHWAGNPNPLFILSEEDGMIYASSQLREGRYDIQFLVSDRVWKQVGVSANVTVVVKVLSQESLLHATSLNLLPTTPTQLTRGWQPSTGGGILGQLNGSINEIIEEEDCRAEVVSVYGTDSNPNTEFRLLPSLSGNQPQAVFSNLNDGYIKHSAHENSVFETSAPYACVWVSAIDSTGSFMNPVKFQGLLALNSKKLERATGLQVTFKDPLKDFGRSGMTSGQPWESLPHSSVAKEYQTSGSPTGEHVATSTLKGVSESEPETVASLASTVLPLQVVDTNITSLVTPLLLRTSECLQRPFFVENHRYNLDSCTPSSCLNGGKCLRFPSGSRCICPGGSMAPHCKVVSRTFKEHGWIWLKPLPSCLPTTISFRLLTKKPNGLLLYSGPLVSPTVTNRYASTSMLTVQLVEGRLELLLEGMGPSVKLQVNSSIADSEWHTVHVHVDDAGVALMVDMCGLGWTENSQDDSHCVARKPWEKLHRSELWESIGPLQVGGIAQLHPRSSDFGWEGELTEEPFEGCLSLLTINDQVVDLGEPSYSQGSVPGCQMQETACKGGPGICGIRGECSGGLRNPQCQCEPGWSGEQCDIPTVPTTLRSKSFMKIAMSFIPPSEVIDIQVRLRALGPKTGVLLHLATQHTNNTLTIHLKAGVACATMSGARWGSTTACVRRQPVGDGKWHTIRVERHGHNLLALVDNGDEGKCNHSILSLKMIHTHGVSPNTIRSRPMPLEIDKQDGLIIGGRPLFSDKNFIGIQDDLQDTCIDDLRVSGRRLPLPPAVNGSSWGQVISSQGLVRGCQSPGTCANVTCKYPLSCHSDWGQKSCSCGLGHHLMDQKCVDVDECLLEPCLHGGTCVNLVPRYECLCGPNHLGHNCEWTKVTTGAPLLSAPMVIGTIAFSFILLAMIGVLLCLRHHRQRSPRRASHEEEGNGETTQMEPIRSGKKGEEDVIVALDPKRRDSKFGRDVRKGDGREGPEDESHSTFLELLKLSRKKDRHHVKGGFDERTSGDERGGESGEITMAVITSLVDDGNRGIESVSRPHPHPQPQPQPQPQSRQHPHQQPHLPGEDLRNYAYEGDGSSSGSLTSAISGLQAEIDREESNKTLVKEFVEVMDLLKNLPDAPKSSSLRTSKNKT